MTASNEIVMNPCIFKGRVQGGVFHQPQQERLSTDISGLT